MRRVIATLPLLAVMLGCDPPPPGELELGVRGAADDFVAVQDGDPMVVVLGANGLNMVVPSFRARGIDPRGPDVEVEVTVAGILMAADIEGSRVDMVENGDGHVLWDIRVPFQTELCCFVCSEGTLEGRLIDRTGRVFETVVTVRLERGGCPDPAVCCANANVCPDPTLTQLCE